MVVLIKSINFEIYIQIHFLPLRFSFVISPELKVIIIFILALELKT